MTAAPRVAIAGDRLYSLTFRPHELALFGQSVAIDLRYAPMIEPGDPPSASHVRVAVLDISTQIPAVELGGGPEDPPRILDLLKIGWELELTCREPLRSGEVGPVPGEEARVVDAIAETVNGLAARAGIAAPIDADLRAELIRQCVLAPPPGA